MPLPDGAGAVARQLHLPRQAGLAYRKMMDLGHLHPRVDNSQVDDVFHAIAVGVPPGQAGRACRRADGHGYIQVRQAAARSGELVEVRGFDHGMAEAAQVAPAHVVHQDKNEIELRVVGGCVARCRPQPSIKTANIPTTTCLLGTSGPNMEIFLLLVSSSAQHFVDVVDRGLDARPLASGPSTGSRRAACLKGSADSTLTR